MAIPTINTVTPSPVHTGGQLITITGTNFRLPDPPDLTQVPVPAAPATVRVLVGGVAASDVNVWSATELTCRTPKLPPGSYSVVISNLNNAGAVIAGETATLANGVTTARPDLASASDLQRVVRELLQQLKLQIIENVVLTKSIDYDSSPGGVTFDLADVASLPAIVLTGPRLERNRTYLDDTRPQTQDAGGARFRLYRTPDTFDLVFRILGVTDNQMQALNLQAALVEFFSANDFVSVLRDPSDSSKGTADYELWLEGELAAVQTPNKSNLRAFTADCRIRGFNFEGFASFMENGLMEHGGVATQPVVLTSFKTTV